MKTMQTTMVLAVVLVMFLGGCGNITESSSSGNGSSSSSVGGTSVTGSAVKVNLTTNRTRIAKGDTALITVSVTCASVNGNCPVVSGGTPLFAASPLSAADTSARSLSITANYSITAAATLTSPASGSATKTLAAGTAATATTSVILGETASALIFPVTITGASVGAAILTAQVLDVTASIVIDVTDTTSGLFK